MIDKENSCFGCRFEPWCSKYDPAFTTRRCSDYELDEFGGTDDLDDEFDPSAIPF